MFNNLLNRFRPRGGLPRGASPAESTPEAILLRFGQMQTGDVLAELYAHRDGLTAAGAGSRLESHGHNIVTSRRPPSWWWLLLTVIPNPFNLLLGFIAIISVASPERSWETFGVLMGMIVISSGVRFWQEYRSLVSIVKLQNSVTTKARVRRQRNCMKKAVEGCSEAVEDVDIDEKDVVPGDMLLLSPGDSIAADCLILDSNYLRISQSSLTGESMPATKAASTEINEKNAESLFDVGNIAFMGTSVVSGSAVALVLATGDGNFIASIMKQLSEKREANVFQRGIRHVTYMLVGFMLTMVPIVLGISGYVTGDWGEAALFSVSVAVGLVPEMLPAIVNTNLARGAHLLAKKKAIVKRLDAIQNLGAMTVLCSDKTGTLTKDEVQLDAYIDCAGLSNSNVFQLAYINAAGQANLRGFTQQQILICKGAFDEILGLSARIRRGPSEENLDATTRQALTVQADKLARSGFRVLLIASKSMSAFDARDADDESLEELESSMTLEGILTFLDPIKDDAAESVTRLRDAGVETKVLTGDSLAVAINVCQTIRLGAVGGPSSDDVEAVTGPELARLDGEVFDNVVRRCSVFAKLTPSQKGLVIRRLRRLGHCVGMLGDGVNDCVALRASDVGISVDSGARAAKDSADAILTQKGLDAVAAAVRIGRVTQGNSIKYVKMVASSNFGNVFSILVASAWLPFTPMSGLQLLIQNLLYDVSQVAIPWDRMDEEYLAEPKRWATRDLLRFIVVLGPTSSVIDMATFCTGWFQYGVRSADDEAAVSLFRTHWFLQGLLTQTLIVHLLRTAKVPVLQSRAAPVVVFATCAVMAVGFAIPWVPPFQTVLGMVQPASSFVGILTALLAAYCVVVQLVKTVYIRIFQLWL